MSLTATERETIIRSDDDCKTWTVFSVQPTIITKLKKCGAEPYLIDSHGGHWYKDLDFNQVSFRSNKKRTMSPEQKAKAADRLRNLHKNKKGESNE